MGKVRQNVGLGSGQNIEGIKKIDGIRRKRKKRRKELEELHRNVLEAKRNSRLEMPQHRRKTAYTKILNNFADQRRENEDENLMIEDAGKSTKRTKKKKICSRLLPEPMVGMFKNGAKGREICKAVTGGVVSETNVARLQSNVLKLLKGDETTNLKSSRKRGDGETTSTSKTAAAVHPPKESNELDCGNEYGDSNKHSPTFGKTNGCSNDRRLHRERDGIIGGQKYEDKCKRRLFQPHNKDKQIQKGVGIIDLPLMTYDSTKRFPPNHRKTDVESPTDVLLDQNVESKLDDKLCTPQRRGARRINFWGWSPAACYEGLCAVVCIDNFDNDRRRRYKVPEQVVKIRRILTELYIRSAQNLRLNKKKKSILDGGSTQLQNLRDGLMVHFDDARTIRAINNAKIHGDRRKHTQQMISPNSSPDASASSITMIGSWHAPKYFVDCNGIGNDKHSRPQEQDCILKLMTNGITIKEDQTMGYRSSNDTDDESLLTKNKNAKKSNDAVQSTINSVSVFLNAFRQRHTLNDRIDKKAIEKKKKNCDASFKMSHDNWAVDHNFNNALRKVAKKHMPTILRRSNGPARAAELAKMAMEHEKRISRAAASRDVDFERVQRRANNVLLPAALMLTPSPINNIHLQNNKSFSPCPLPSVIPNNLNHDRDRTPKQEANKKLVEQDGRGNKLGKFKFNVRNEKLGPKTRQMSLEDNNIEISEENEYEQNLSSRDIRITSGTFVKSINAKNKDHRDIVSHSSCRVREVTNEFCRGAELATRHDQRNVPDEKNATSINERRRYLNRNDEGKDSRINGESLEPRVIRRVRWDDPAYFAEYQGGLKKPVVLFRPMDDPRDKSLRSEISNPHECDTNVDSTVTMREMVTNFRVIAFDRNNGEKSSVIDPCNHFHCKQQQHVSPSRSFLRADQRVENFQSAYEQPVKYLAYDPTNGVNPRKIPIYMNADIVSTENHDQCPPSDVLKMINTNEQAGTTADMTRVTSSYDTRNGNEGQIGKLNVEQRFINNSFSNVPYSGHCSTNLYNNGGTLLRPVNISHSTGSREEKFARRLPSVLHSQLPSRLNRNEIRSQPNLDTTNDDSKKIVYSILPHCQAPTRTQSRYDSCRPIREQYIDDRMEYRTNLNLIREFRDVKSTALPKRIQLLDGGIGTLVAENLSTDHTSELSDLNNVRRATNMRIINAARQLANGAGIRQQYYILDKEGMYSQLGYR